MEGAFQDGPAPKLTIFDHISALEARRDLIFGVYTYVFWVKEPKNTTSLDFDTVGGAAILNFKMTAMKFIFFL